ncbi:hypothetical protein AXA44_43470 [Rhodococcus sp. SC4]|uniref:GlcG/HbpS family heme-binding protein n=1 Tax=Rhodococcus sp. T2V TaxID=3034164 RepID=UPI00076A9E9E|nr:heme-binding protein [Rhodococcus sp. T2V]KXF53739.1 hypothetical protein AXA44_43470 [Rhodococcus sp. SC4]MDF3311833.1 heme-binding protein [Rhodococcus sp. T2V]RYE41361.1 MAG: heme-binding protein [Hyphomicrobiales bacterium]
MTSPSFTTNTITLRAANAAIEAGLQKAQELGLAVTIAVTDPNGVLKAYQRMEGASVLSTDIAVRKARTAATSGFNTGALFDFIKTDPALLHGMTNVPDYAVFGGGEQISHPELGVIGAVGVSGAHYSEDEQIALAAVESVLTA